MKLLDKILKYLARNKVRYNMIEENSRWIDYKFRVWKDQNMPQPPKPPAWFAHWNKGFKQELDERFSSLETKVDENSKAIQRLEAKVDNNSKAIQRLETKVDENSKNIKKILDCPTIQQEIQ